MAQNENLASYRKVLEYAHERGRKLGKTKLFDDINSGKLKKQADGSFRLRDVDRYLASLPMAGTPDPVAERARDRQRRKEESEIRRITLAGDHSAFDLAVKQGKFIAREAVYQELVGRAIALQTGLKANFEARCLEIIGLCDGDPKKSAEVTEFLGNLLDAALHEYSAEMELEISFDPDLVQGIRQEASEDVEDKGSAGN